MNWFYPTRAFRSMIGKDGGTDDRFAHAAAKGFGAFILGRNMFGPAGDDWGGPDWKGWWGDNPPYHAPTFILTHHARAPIVMEGGTTFHFVTDGIEAALARAKTAAGDLDVKIGGGVSTIRQYLLAKAIDELHLALSPVVLGRGESLFAGIDLDGSVLSQNEEDTRAMYGANVPYVQVLKGNQVTPAPAHKFVGTVAKYFVISKNDNAKNDSK